MRAAGCSLRSISASRSRFLCLGIKFFQEAFHIIPHVLEMKEADLILGILSMVDMGLVGGLIVMVMFSGYEKLRLVA